MGQPVILSRKELVVACAISWLTTTALVAMFPLPPVGAGVVALTCGYFAARCVIAWKRQHR